LRELVLGIPPNAEHLTLDSVLGGRLTVVQPKKGYRFSVDALLLADFVEVRPGWSVVDLGAGSGVIGLILACRMGRGRVIAVERQPELAAAARLSADRNPGLDFFQVLELDWSSLTPDLTGGPVDAAVVNPPYRRVGSGRINPNRQQAEARHEIMGDLASAASAAARVLSQNGRLSVIYPAVRLVELTLALDRAGLTPKRMRMVHSRMDEEARLVLVEARPGAGRQLTVLPPLLLYGGPGRDYTPEARAIFNGRFFAD
jgi:tRNA1Val (adenine37-N6)-methyltransferase